MYKIITIGEALIDFIPNQKGCQLKEVHGFERVAGGAPANVAAAIAKLSGNAYLYISTWKRCIWRSYY